MALGLVAVGGARGAEGSREQHTLAGQVTAVVVGLRCPLKEGNTVRVSDASHRILAEGRLGEPETTRVGNVERCIASFEIDGLPRSDPY